MANKKRKTLQIKRPSADPSGAKKKPGPAVNKEASAEEGTIKVGPKSGKGSTARISLPDEDKIRRARGSDASEDLKNEEKMPSAEQIEQAQNNETMQINIDEENIEAAQTEMVVEEDQDDSMDQTMQINTDDIEAAQTQMVVEEEQEDGMDQTMQIDTDSLIDSDQESQLEKAATPENLSDQTLEMDAEELEKSLTEEESSSEETEPESNDFEDPGSTKKMQGMETMKMETMPLKDGVEDELTRQDMEESFNAQTMAMDPNKLAEELANASAEENAEESTEEDPNRTMDLTQQDQPGKEDPNMTMDLTDQNRPKTVMIKRPSREQAGPNAPTVKAARPNAETIKAARPVTANRGEPKESTSRVDIPDGEGESDSKQGKTIKLRRPTGGPSISSSTSGVASRAGITLDENGDVTIAAKKDKPLGGPWVAVAIITFLISLGAIWAIVGISQPELPMPGRLVDVNQQLIQR